jgi:hypothetical protein
MQKKSQQKMFFELFPWAGILKIGFLIFVYILGKNNKDFNLIERIFLFKNFHIQI